LVVVAFTQLQILVGILDPHVGLLNVDIDIDVAFGKIVELAKYVILRFTVVGGVVFFLGLTSVKNIG